MIIARKTLRVLRYNNVFTVQRKRMKFIIDADPGIDDAMALCMALEQHKRGLIKILAISLVCGNTTINYQKINIIRILKLFPDIYGEVRQIVASILSILHYLFIFPPCRFTAHYLFPFVKSYSVKINDRVCVLWPSRKFH
jgi:hypothetical protein